MKRVNLEFETDYLRFEDISFDTNENRLHYHINNSTMTFAVAEITNSCSINGQILPSFGRNDLIITNTDFKTEIGFEVEGVQTNQRRSSWILVDKNKINIIIENFINQLCDKYDHQDSLFSPISEFDILQGERFLADKLLEFKQILLLKNCYLESKMIDLKLEEFIIYCLQSKAKTHLLQNYYNLNDDISVLTYLIKSDLSKNWSAQELATKVGMSESSIYRYFDKTLGISPNQFISNLKINKAKQDLVDHNYLSLSEIGNRIGIHSPSYFSKFFKRHTGKSPISYREKYNNH